MDNLAPALEVAAQLLATELHRTGNRIVLAESCTGGLVAATLTTIPGISNHFCGSAVTYRGATKIAWLGVSTEDVHRDDAVNEEVAHQMAAAVLANTPEATLSVSVTGHLGPDAPPLLDGVVFIAIASSDSSLTVERHRLATTNRRNRQHEAASLVMLAAREWILRR